MASMIAPALKCLAATLLSGAAAVASAQDFQVSTPQDEVAAEPGQTVDIPLVIDNHTSTTSPELHLVLTDTVGDYTFAQGSEPDCGSIVPDPELGDWTEFSIAPIAAGGSRTCTVRVTRGADEINNAFIDWFIQEADSWVEFDVGTFVNVGIAAQKVTSSTDPDGTLHATVRLSASNNQGAISVEDIVVGLAPQCIETSVVVDLDFPGACPSANAGCAFGGGFTAGAQLPTLAPGTTASCLVRFTAPPDADPDVQLYLLPGLQNAATGGYVNNEDDSNTLVDLDLSAGGIAAPSPMPALSWWSLAALILALTAIAGFRYAQRR